MNDPDPRHTSDGFDPDAIFADIIAHLNDDAGLDDPTRPDGSTTALTEDAATAKEPDDSADDEAAREQPPTGDLWKVNPSPPPPAPDESLPLPGPQVWRAQDAGDEADEHFEPRPVAPLPVGDLQFWAIIVGMCGGPLLLLYLVFFNREAGSLWILTAITMSVGGFVLLVSRMPGHQGDDDDGARL